MIFQFLLLLSLVYATPEARQFILEAKNDNQALVAKFINCSMIDITFLSQLKPVESDVIYLSASDGSEDIITEITAQSKFDLERIFSKICSVPLTYNHILNKSSADQVFKLIDSGSPSNRIDVVLMGDGYQLNQKQKFLDDMNRLVSEMWNDVTFKSFVPLVNVWAVFRPSTDAGIGANSRPLQTSFGLYRDGTELRGIYCSKPYEARSACKSTGPDACDFPSLIANDDYYGGLGGEFTISTRSMLSGTVVLRHEMGHNFVGEEYDNGQVYSGVNSDTASSLNDLKWKHWLSETTVKEENMKASLLAYPWHDLAKGSKRLVFNTDGKFEKWVMRISASGVETPGSLTVKLDDKYLDWKPRGDFDREFYNWEGSTLEAGSHVVEISQGFSPVTGAPIRQICSVEVHEYGKGFRIIKINLDSNNSYIGAYPTFDINGRKTYRPSNEACLMRNMKSNKFCPVCQEGLWLRFLKKVDLIDKLLIENTKVIAVLVPLAHLRPLNSRIQGESLSVKWFFNGVEQIKFDGSLEIEAEIGDWELKVSFSTPEIRLDPKGYTKSNRKFTI